MIILMGSLARAGKNKGQTPFVPRTNEKEISHKRKRLRKKFNMEVKSHCSGAIHDVNQLSSSRERFGLTDKDVERQLFIREKRLWYESRHYVHGVPAPSNTKKPHKKERETVDEFYYQEMFGDVE